MDRKESMEKKKRRLYQKLYHSIWYQKNKEYVKAYVRVWKKKRRKCGED